MGRCVRPFIGRSWTVAEAHHIERNGREELQVRMRRDALGEIRRLFDILLDLPPVGINAVGLEREPHLERTKRSRELWAKLVEAMRVSLDATFSCPEVAGGAGC